MRQLLEEATLPDSVQVIGSCAFYNCRSLRLLTVAAGDLPWQRCVSELLCAGDLRVQAAPEQPTGLFALVNNITEAVQAQFWPADAPAPLAALWYPAYWEDIEETPAHILLHTFSGQGYHYRQCFLDNKFLPAEYDAIFPQGTMPMTPPLWPCSALAPAVSVAADRSCAGHYRRFWQPTPTGCSPAF